MVSPPPLTLAPLTPHAPIRTVAAIVNVAAGGVGAGAPAELGAILARFGLQADLYAPQPAGVADALAQALKGRPDLLIVLAGDGTARAAAALCGPQGPLLAPLPGGTMNMLPHALYGSVNWQTALVSALSEGFERPVGGGEIDGQAFFVAAILGSPALWARAREAVRQGRLDQAFYRARLALRGAFRTKLKFSLDGALGRAEALTLMCPAVSKAMTEETALEALAIDPSQPGEIVRVGFHALATELFGAMAGDWRNDPVVNVGICHTGRIWASGSIPAVLDGEPIRFPRQIAVKFVPVAFRALASRRPAGPAILGDA